MKVLSIGTDRSLFNSTSTMRGRILEYGKLFDELRVIVLTVKNLGLKPEKISENVWIYPTNSSSRLFYLFDAWRIGRSWRGKFNVITAQDPFETGLVAWLLKLSTGVKFQLQIHTDFLSPNFKKTWLNFWRVRLAKFLLPRADGIRTVSQKIINSIKRAKIRLKTEPVILPIWVDVEALRQAPITFNLWHKYRQFKKIILMVSRLESEKQIDLAIKNLADFLRGTKNVGLIIVGSGSEEQKLNNLVKELNLDDLVRFEGWQEKENLVAYYKTANLFLTTSRYEGYGLAIVEATACGLPVVATDVGVALEIGAIIIEDFANLGSLIKKLFDSPVKIEIRKEWPTKNEYLTAYRQSLEI
jgi:glycosyltransferase involved in cell wall biosynthesis